ncbi:hypothetical protein MRB53_041521 [Persea americana]|nr:hypothetical protein MRB53_041521 [Persea americana]
MRAFVTSRLPREAQHIMEKVMPAAGLVADSRHYAIMMLGFERSNQSHIALRAHSRMLRQRVVPDHRTQRILQQAEFSNWMRDQHKQVEDLSSEEKLEKWSKVSESPLTRKESIAHFKQAPLRIQQLGLLSNDRLSDANNRDGGKTRRGVSEIRRAFKARSRAGNNGNAGCFDVIIHQTEELRERDRTHDFDEEEADGDLTSTDRAPTTMRSLYALDIHIRWALVSMRRRNDVRRILSTISKVADEGYRFTSSTWNIIVQSTVRVEPPLAMIGFSLTEQHLIDSFPGLADRESACNLLYLARENRAHASDCA